MSKTFVALYDDFDVARAAVEELIGAGFNRDDISLIANDTLTKYGAQLDANTRETLVTDQDASAAEGAGFGAVVGALTGLGALLLPGIGPIVAAGPLASALVASGIGAAVGAATGGIVAALVDLGVPEEEAHSYAESVRRGGTLVSILVNDERADQALDILQDHNPVNLDERGSYYRESGWSRFEGTTEPLTPEEINADRAKRTDWARQFQKLPSASSAYQSYVRGYILEPTTNKSERDLKDTSAQTSDRASMQANRYEKFYEYDTDFRNHYNTAYANSGYDYDWYTPAYQYGYALASDERYRGYQWNQIEPAARRRWEERNGDTWDQFKDAVQTAWNKVRAALDV